MELLSISSPLCSNSLPSLGSLGVRYPLSKTPILSLRPFTSYTSSKYALGAHQLSGNPKTLAGGGLLELELEEPQLSLRSSAPQTPATAMRGAEADALGLLLKERIVFLGNQIDDFAADAIISQLLLLDAQDHTRDIRLFVNSPGGSLRYASVLIGA